MARERERMSTINPSHLVARTTRDAESRVMGKKKYSGDARTRRDARTRAMFAKKLARERERHHHDTDVDDGRARATDDGRALGRGFASGRLDVMGGIADYSGAVVCQLGTRRETRASVRFDETAEVERGGTIRIASTMRDEDEDGGAAKTIETVHVDVLAREAIDAVTFAPEKTRMYFAGRRASERWAAYVVGAMTEFFRALEADEDGSMVEVRRWVRRTARARDWTIEIESNVPRGKGTASSAAVEIAVARATSDYLVRAGLISTAAMKRFRAHVAMIPLYCQAAENDVVGAPCGFMDQYACFHSTEQPPGRFVAIDCDFAKMSTPEREEEEYSFVDLPKELRVWAIDSGVRHANAGGESDYSRVRCGTFMGKKVLVNELNARYYRTLVPGEVSLCGFLSAHAWDHGSAGVPIGWSQLVEEELSGASFLARFIRHDDEPNTSVDPERTYALRAPVHHALHEHARVQEFLHLLRSWPKTSPADDETVLSLGRRLGDLMFASHDSYTSVGLGADATDALVDLVREVDPDRRLLFGAKISGGGCGGAVVLLGRDTPDAIDAVDAVRRRYAAKYSLERVPTLLAGAHPSDASE